MCPSFVLIICPLKRYRRKKKTGPVKLKPIVGTQKCHLCRSVMIISAQGRSMMCHFMASYRSRWHCYIRITGTNHSGDFRRTNMTHPRPSEFRIVGRSARAVVAERLRRQTRNLMGSPRAGSNPAGCEVLCARLAKLTMTDS